MKKATSGTFVSDIESRIDYFRKEFSITYAEIIGALDIVKHRMLVEEEVRAAECDDDDDDEEEFEVDDEQD